MKFSLTDIATEEDRQRALAMLHALAPVMRSDVAPTPVVVEMPVAEPVAEEPAKKTRRVRKTNGTAEPEPAAESIPATAPVGPEPATEVDDETAREELRQVARTKGVTWLREILTGYQAARLGDLTIGQVREVLRAAA